jgi:uncharacterized protein
MDLREFFSENKRVALAFSGGVDSAYLLYAALQYAEDVTAYYVKSAFQPQFELDDALRLAQQLGARMKVLPLDVLADGEIAANTAQRCYFCKRRIMTAIMQAAQADGYTLLIDGTNASDAADDRPGMRALTELQVRSPLRECGLSKADIRLLSREAGLFTWDKPAYACLATRVRCGDRITAELLCKIEAVEEQLMRLGFRDFRMRINGDAARFEVTEAQLPLAKEKIDEVTAILWQHFPQYAMNVEVRHG